MKNFLIVVLFLLLAGFVFIFVKPDHSLSQKVFEVFNISLVQELKEPEIDLTDCLSYFDGCNTCMVSGGIIGGCTKMFCQKPTEPQCLEYEWTGMDLSGCVSYFDGCNNCSVENGRPSACTLMYCETYEEPKCLQTKPAIDLTNCRYYFDGCNNCSVKEGKIDACTEIYCETPSEPKCNEYMSESEMTGSEINGNNIDAFFENYKEAIDIAFKNALIDRQLAFIVIPNHDSISVNPKGVIDIDGGYRFSITEKNEVCTILQTLNRSDFSCYDEADGAQIYIEFKKNNEADFQLWIAHYLGMTKTDLVKKIYPTSAE